MSIHPRFVKELIEGRKSVEIRRTRVTAVDGTSVLIYATAPTKALVATARLVQIVNCDADQAWEDHGDEIGLSRAELDAYLEGKRACLLLLHDVRRLSAPLALDVLRSIDNGFLPPQSYRYVERSDSLAVAVQDAIA